MGLTYGVKMVGTWALCLGPIPTLPTLDLSAAALLLHASLFSAIKDHADFRVMRKDA